MAARAKRRCPLRARPRRRPIGRLIAVDRQPASALARERAKRVQMSERTGQMEQRRPQPVGVRKSDSDLSPVEEHIEPPLAMVQRASDVRQPADLVDRRRRVLRRGHDLDVAIRFLPAPERADCHAASTPGVAASRARIGSTIAVARPRGIRGAGDRKSKSAAAILYSTAGSSRAPRGWLRFRRQRRDRRPPSRRAPHEERQVVQSSRRLLRRASEDPRADRRSPTRRAPRACVVHVLQRCADFRIDPGGGRLVFEDGAEVCVGFDVMIEDEGRGAPEECRFGRLAPDAGEQSETLERAMERIGGSPAGMARNRPLAFQRARLGTACLGASFVSVGRLAASHSAMPPFKATAR